jgi:hypothetical protein
LEIAAQFSRRAKDKFIGTISDRRLVDNLIAIDFRKSATEINGIIRGQKVS